MKFNNAQKIYLRTLLKAELSCVQNDIKIVEAKTNVAKEYNRAKNILIAKERFIQESIGTIEGED